jgi:2-polyprenyl-6-methoxyphenol hydroxylase-like FAD-dependent oxidoreductase
MRILICGGGIGGLTAAVALRQHGFEPVVFERADALRASGSGIHVWTNAMFALDSLGLADRVLEIATPQQEMFFRTWRGDVLARWPVGAFAERYGQPTVAIQRNALLGILQGGLDGVEVHTGKELVGFTQDAAEVTAAFADGSQFRGDLLIGADGVGSAVRAQLLGDGLPRYAGYIAWRGIAELDMKPGSFSSLYGQRGNRFVFYDVRPGRVHWMSVANGPAFGTDGPGVKGMLLARHRGWMDPVKALIEATPEDAIHRTDVVDRKPNPKWGEGRVTMLGDAAHAMTFNVGQGACMAMEDGVVLAEKLAAGTRPPGAGGSHLPGAGGSHLPGAGGSNVPAILRDYETERYPRVASMQKAAWILGRLGAWHSPFAVRLRELIVRAGWERGAFKAIEKEAAYGVRWRAYPSLEAAA